MNKFIKILLLIITISLAGYFINQYMIPIKNLDNKNDFSALQNQLFDRCQQSTGEDNVIIQCGSNCCNCDEGTCWFYTQGNCGSCGGKGDQCCKNHNCVNNTCFIECGTGYTQTGCGTCEADDQKNGTSCTSNAECSSGNCYSGICETCISNQSSIECPDNGQCCSGNSCTAIWANGFPVNMCLSVSGSACTNDNYCASLQCNDGVCT